MLDSSSAPVMEPTSELTAADAELARVLEECLAEIESGRAVDPARLVAEHPAIAERLRTCLVTLDLVHQAAVGLGTSKADNDTLVSVGRLGDFHIVREIGRGGMGVVYEAQQISLGRRVALKVLPFAATLDPRQLQRFLTEAQAAALLHHVHVVPVYSVGCERGVHYYAMQYIEGQSLAEVIAVLKRQRPDLQKHHNLAPASSRDEIAAEPAQDAAEATSANPTAVALTTELSSTGPAYFRAVARLGVQAAGALEHAHQLGVIHRDIKPANLLVDAASNVWITDFGLARLRTQPGLTLTGDTVGTMRYMSPEQALAGRAPLDHRTDIYSLGATLYEALTLEPAYPGDNRAEVLRKISLGEPPPPRRLNPAVPFELETIILKAMAAAPERRYLTAQEFAEDLERFLAHRPIHAVRPRLPERLSKWAWRHNSVLLAVAVVTALAAVGLLAMTILLWQERGQTKAAFDLARTRGQEAQVNRERAEENFRKALEGLTGILWELENQRWAEVPGFDKPRQELTRQVMQIFQKLVITPSADPAVRFQAARTYESIFNVYFLQRQFGKASDAHARAIALYEELETEFPAEVEYSLVLGRARWTAANWNFSFKRHGEAQEEYRQAMLAYRRALRSDPDGTAHNRLAYALCACQEVELRDPLAALSLARKAVALAPTRRDFWNTLGLAHYRTGEWPAARAALEKAMELSDGGDARDWLLLAMDCWRQGKQAESRLWYDKADVWMRKNPITDELCHFRMEGSALLGIRWPALEKSENNAAGKR